MKQEQITEIRARLINPNFSIGTYCQDINSLLDALDESPWITIESDGSNLPENGEWVSATDGKEWRKMQMLEFGGLSFSGSHEFDANVIAYMLIPELPKKEGE